MSLPTAPVVSALAQSGSVSSLDLALMSLNSNPYFIGMMMLLLNFGGRFLSMEMTKGQEQFFHNTWVRRFLIFIVIFVGTRNIFVAFWMSLFIILCIGYLFNENSSLCIFNMGTEGSKCASSSELVSTAPNGLTTEETEILKRLQEKQSRATPGVSATPITSATPNVSASKNEPSSATNASKQSHSDIYWQNMLYLNKEGFMNPRF